MCSVFLLLIGIPLITNAQIIINEIQYNPDGPDGGYEWLELYNNSENPISIKGFTLRESDKNHRITQIDESLGWSIPNGGYAILADNPTKFLEKHPGYPGLVFDSSFTLVNTGELLELLDTEGELLFGITYKPEWGGDGDGSTLGIENGAWKATNTSPGRPNTSFVEESQEEEVSEESSDSPTNTPSEASETKSFSPVVNIPAAYIRLADPDYKEKTIKADAGPDRTVLSGVPFIFSGTGYGLAGGILEESSYYWNFGDGIRQEGNEVLHAYTGPGTYTGTLKIVSGKYSHTDHFLVTVVPPNISLTGSFEDQTIIIKNHSPHTIEVSNFILDHQNSSFTFPEESFISASSQIILNANSLELPLSDSEYLYFRAPNKHLINSYHGAVEQIKAQIALRQDSVLEHADTEQEVAPNKDTEGPASQIVYIGVPHTIEEENLMVSALDPSSPQTATISNVRKELFSPFEMFLFIAFALVAGIFGFVELKKYRKNTASSISIEEI